MATLKETVFLLAQLNMKNTFFLLPLAAHAISLQSKSAIFVPDEDVKSFLQSSDKGTDGEDYPDSVIEWREKSPEEILSSQGSRSVSVQPDNHDSSPCCTS